MNIEISKERMLEMAKKLASMDFCPEQRVFYKNILRMVKADVEGRLLVLPCKVGDTVYGSSGGRCQSDKWISVDDVMPAEKNSIFAKLKGTDKWNSVMWEKTSGEVIVCI